MKRKKRKVRSFGPRTPIRATMEIRDVDHLDPESGAAHLTDEAVRKGREWVTYLQL